MVKVPGRWKTDPGTQQTSVWPGLVAIPTLAKLLKNEPSIRTGKWQSWSTIERGAGEVYGSCATPEGGQSHREQGL